jgi:hypothetical protein
LSVITALDSDAEGPEVGPRSTQEGDRRLCPLVRQHLDVGEPRRVVDADVDVLPTDVEDPAVTAAA